MVTELGSIWPFHQMLSTPARPATKPARANASVRCSGTLKPSELIRTGVVADPFQGQPERRAAQRPEADVGEQPTATSDGVVQADRVVSKKPGGLTPVMPPKPEIVVTWPNT